MGRPEYCDIPDDRCRVFKLKMVDGDYDEGGAYWGGGADIDPMYACIGPDTQLYTRAKNRAQAKREFRSLFPHLKWKN
jgi:coproporphyrinogen III oxidase